MNCYETVLQKIHWNYTWAWLYSKVDFFFLLFLPPSLRILIQNQKLVLFGTERIFPVYFVIP